MNENKKFVNYEKKKKFCCNPIGKIDQLSKNKKCFLCKSKAVEIHKRKDNKLISICEDCHEMISYEEGIKVSINRQEEIIKIVKFVGSN